MNVQGVAITASVLHDGRLLRPVKGGNTKIVLKLTGKARCPLSASWCGVPFGGLVRTSSLSGHVCRRGRISELLLKLPGSLFAIL